MIVILPQVNMEQQQRCWLVLPLKLMDKRSFATAKIQYLKIFPEQVGINRVS